MNPPAAQPGTTITVNGSAFPTTGSIFTGDVNVTITPPAGNGSPVTTVAGNFFGTAPNYSVQFTLPPSLTVSTPEVCTISISDSTPGDADFTTATQGSITINPPATVLSASPGAGQLGANGITLAVVGAYTQFTTNTSVTLTLSQNGPPAVTTTINQVGATTFVDAQHVSATFNIPAGDPLGAYTVTAITGTEVAVLPGGFLVANSGPLSLTSVTPNTLPAGQGTLVTVVGSGTNFVQGTTVAAFGDGITAGPVTVTDATDASFQIVTDPIAYLGGRTLTMATGGQFATGTFSITNNGSTLTQVGATLPAACASACSFPQGSNATLSLTGSGTHWIQAGTSVSVGGGINAGNITVTSTGTLLVNISVGPGVPVGSYPVTVTTNGEVVTMASALAVTAATPYLSNAAPNQGAQGQQNLNVTFTGVFTSFNVGSLSANFGPNITVNSITPAAGAAGATSATANISIDFTAFAGGRSGALTSNGTIFNFTFTVTPSSATMTGSSPASGLQGASVALLVTSANTHWQQGLTFAELGAGIVVNRVIICPGTVSDPSTLCANGPATSAEVDISIPTNAGVGTTGITMSTGGEIVSLSNAFTVLPYTPSLTMAPSSGMIPVAPATSNIVNVNFQGNFTHFALNQTIAAIDGNGVTIQNFTVLNKWNATAQFNITAPLSQASPALPCTNEYGGNHIVTLETPIATGSEIVYTGFCVTSTPAVLTSINPYHSPEPMNNLTVTITGLYTHFEGPSATNPTGTTVGFGPNITVLPGSINIVNSTTLTCTIQIAANAALGWRPVFVNTIDTNPAAPVNEQLTIGFGIDPPATSSLLSVLPPSGIQGQSLTVQITGNLTNWAQGNTVAFFGTGISVNTLTINGTASATAQISIDPVNAPVGGSTVTMVTQLASGNEEVVSGPLFSVTQGIASVDHTGPACPTNGNYTESGLRIGGRLATEGGTGCQQHQLELYQGTITPLFLIVGTNTHWLQGETTLNFGSDIAVSQLNVLSPTVIQCQIAVSYTATLGYRGFTATTNAEVAPSFSDALDILPVQGSSVNITPTSGTQGTTFTIQVNGTNTHWTSAAGPPNNTTATFGSNNGVNVTGITVVSQTQMNLSVQVLGTADVGPYTLTITTTGLPIGPPPMSPQSTEQLVLNNILGIGPGAAIITNVTPTSGTQNGTEQITVVGQNTSFLTGVTTAYYSTGGCNPPSPAGINVSNVTASDHTHATLALAVSATAPTGYQTLCMYTQGESVSYANAFEVLPGNPTLNEVSVTGPPPATGTAAQQGETVNVSILGQFTHWTQGITTVTFGQGITVTNLTIVSQTSATATLAVDGDAYIGGRATTVTTNNEIVSGNFFSVTQSDAIITSISPTSANQGQHILMTITGSFTHWSQELTQFSISGGGYDIKVNGVVINSPTQAIADLSILTISGNAGLGTRSIYMSTVGENVSLQSALLITGGVPSIVSISPGYGTQGDTADNVLITGQFTVWDSTSVVAFGDPCITVQPASTVNSNTSITAVIAIGAAGSACPATTGLHTVTVTTGVSPNLTAQLGQYTVYSKAAPPSPYISYEYPSVALVGQTLAVNLDGAYTNWVPSNDPGGTTVSFGAGIQVNTVALQELDVTSPTSATANITIEPGATVGPRTVTVTTGSQTLTTTFYVTVGTPEITLVSTNTAAQGETRLLDLVGQYTTWDSTTVFAFCSGIDSVSNVQVFGPTAARVQVVVDPLANTGYCPVTATTGAQVVGLGGGGYFGITPSSAAISSVTPNTTGQNTTTPLTIQVTGFATLWTTAPTTFSFGGGNVSVVTTTINSNTSATLTVTTSLYAPPGFYNLTATTGGVVATLSNAFVVTPGTPILLSLTNSNNKQQAAFSLGILGQYTAWTGANTTVTFPSGGVTGVAVDVTGPQSITVTGSILPTAYPGCGSVVVTTTGQVPPILTTYGFCITYGPAAVTEIGVVNSGAPSPLNPLTSIGQGATNATVNITGTNTNFLQGTTVASFGPGISVNTLTINSPTTATAVVTVGEFATPEANTVTLTTAGEVASDPSSLTIFATTPVVLDVFPNSATQGQGTVAQPLDVCITAAYTHFVDGNTTANFGPGITINKVNIANLSACSSQGPSFVNDGAHADVNISISATAFTTPGNTNHVEMITNLSGGAQEIAVWQNSSATTQYNFTINAGGASILSATPTTPSTVRQNDTADSIAIVGSGTHFLAATPNIAFCTGVTTTGQSVIDNTHITATVSVSQSAPVGACGVTVTTLGEVANGTNLFNVTGGLPVLTQVSPNNQPQGAGQPTPVTVTITGLYTHFQSGGLGVAFPSGVSIVTGPTASSNTSLTVGISVGPTATPGAGNVTVTDTSDVSLTVTNGFTITVGQPAITSVSPNSGGQGTTQTVTITGNYTSWTSGSVVQVSGGSDVTIGTPQTLTNLPNGYQQTIQVPFTVTLGAAATNRTVYVTTASQQLSLGNAFNVLPGTTTITQISPNIGVPGVVNLSVNITGIFTHFTSGGFTVSFGPGISVNGFAEGAAATVSPNSATSATVTLSIDASLASGTLPATRNVTITDTTDGSIVVNNGFTVEANTNTPPTIVYISPANGAGSVPTNTEVTVVFSEPMNAATMTSANVAISDGTVTGCDPTVANALPQSGGSPSLDASGRILTLTPAALLGVGRTFYLTVNNSNVIGGTPIVSDQSGNHLPYNQCYSFTTGFAPDNTGPAFVSANIAPSATGVPTNAPIILGFNKPINPATIPAGIAITLGANPVNGTWGYSSDFTQAIFTPVPNLTASTTYNVAYSNTPPAAITNAVDTPLVSSGSFSFTTGTATLTSGTNLIYVNNWYYEYTPQNNMTTGINPTIRVVFNQPINPLTVNASTFWVYNYQEGGSYPILGSVITHSPDNTTYNLALPGPLSPSTEYHVDAYYMYDWANNQVCCSQWNFYTGASATPDTTPPVVVTSVISPPSGATGVPVNPEIEVHFSKPLDPTKVAQSNISLTPSAAGTVNFVNGDFTTVTFTPISVLSASTTYTINVSGFFDLDGNAMTAFGGSSFTTGNVATADTSHGNVTATPTNGATNVPVNTQVVVTLSKPLDPATVNSTSLHVYDQTGGAYVPGATVISANYETLTFSPTNPWEPSHIYQIRASYDASLYDLAGNYFNSLYQTFTAGATADTTPPTVSASPSGGVTDIGPTNPVILTFSKSMNSGTLGNNVAIYNGITLYTSGGYSLSSDNTTVTFNSGFLPYSTTFTIVVNPAVTDLAGNHIAAPFSTTFTTGAQPLVARPSVTAMRPGNGATGVGVNNPITFFMSAPMNPSTITPSTLLISQNGVLVVGGTISVTGNNQDVEYTPPAAGFAGGALIQSFFTNGAQDTNGNLLNNFQSQFSTAAVVTSTTPPSPVSYYPCVNNSCGSSDATTVIDILFNKPLNQATLAGNVTVKYQGGGSPILTSLSLLNGGRLLRIKPSSPLSATYYYVYLTTGIQDLSGNAAVFPSNANPYSYYFYATTTSNSAAPSVIATAPTNGATGIGTNAVASVTVNGTLDPLTLDPSNVTLSYGAGTFASCTTSPTPSTCIPLSLSYSSGTTTVTPMAPLPPSTLITLTMNGVTDDDGDALNPTPYTLQFTTEAVPDFNPPSVISTNIVGGQTNVPITTGVTLTFSKPIDWRTVNYGIGNSLIMRDNGTEGVQVVASVTPIGSNGILITPISPTFPLNVDHTYQVYGCGVADLNGNVAGCYYTNFSFVTAFNTPAGGPVVTQITPPSGGIAPTNFQPQVQFDRPLNPLSLGGVTLKQGAATVPATPVLTSGGTILTLVPSAILTPNTGYTFTVAGVQDPAGNTQTGSVARAFTTGSGFTLIAPQVTSYTPINTSTTGEQPVIQITFNEPLNPIQTSFVFQNNLTGRSVYGTQLIWASNDQSVTFQYPGALDPNSHYVWYMNTITDLAGNTNDVCCYYFYTDNGGYPSGELVTSVTPPSGQGGVPTNALITLQLANPADPNSVNNSSVILSTLPGPVAVAGTAVSLSASGTTLTLTYPSTLAASTTYQINVPSGGFLDQDGNSVAPFSSSFTTGTSTDVSNSETIAMSSPSPASLGNPLNTAITATFSTPLDPNSLSGQYFEVCENQNCSYQIAGVVTNPSPNTLVFTPEVALPSNMRIDVYVGYNVSILDLAGNAFNGLHNYFSTASAPDITPPSVVAISPANGATDIGPYAPIAITFSKSLNYNTIGGANFVVYNGPNNVGASVSYSNDRTVVYLSTTLPYSSNITVAISTNVQDLNGNNMASPCSAPLTASCSYSFTTETQPLTSNPSVIQQRPGNGAGTTIPITLYVNAPMSHSTIQDGSTIFVSENGVLQHGTVSFTADSQGIIWTPNSAFLPSALIEMWLDAPAADINGNQLNNYYTYYTTGALPPSNSTAPVEAAYTPCTNCTEPAPELQPIWEVEFSKPINCATATNTGVVAGSSFYLLGQDSVSHFVSGTVSCPFPNVVRLTPSSPLIPNDYYRFWITNAIQDTNGNSFAGDTASRYFYVQGSAVADNTPPTVADVTPLNGDTNIGDNAPIRVVFGKLIDTLSFNANTVSLQSSSVAIPYTVTFSTLNNNNTQTVATLMPESPLPDSATITLTIATGANGIVDFSGNGLTSQNTNVSFTTKAGADFSAPSVVSQSIDADNNTNVPVNSTLTLIFNKPLDPSTILTGSSWFRLYDYSGTGDQTLLATPSMNGLVVTMQQCAVSAGVCSPVNLNAGHHYLWEWCNATDLNGNAMSCGNRDFYTSSSADTTAPSVISTNPLNGNTTTAPTNAMIEVDFSEAVRATSLSSITLTNGAGSVPITAVLNNGIYPNDTVVRLIPQQLLLDNTAYTVSVSGVQDVAGNTMTGPYTFSFTTRSFFQEVGLVLPTVTVTTGSVPEAMPTSGTLTNVLDSPTFTVVFDHALDYSALFFGGVTMRDTSNNIVAGVTLNYVLSADQKTLTVTTAAPLSAATTYHFALEVGSGVWLYDIAGNQTSGWGSQTYSFTTQ